MAEKLRQVARDEGRSLSQLVRAIIRPYLEGRRLRLDELANGLPPGQPGIAGPIVEDIMNDYAADYRCESLEAPARVSLGHPFITGAVTVFGIDFTSAPARRKPILGLECRLVGDVLEIVGAQPWRPLRTFAEFAAFLQAPPPPRSDRWIAGADLPFGLSQTFVRNMNWEGRWGSTSTGT